MTIQELKLGLEEGQFPRYLYKYRPICDFTENIFKQSALWFSKPSAFNDPFDSQLNVDCEYSKSDIQRWVSKHFSAGERSRLIAFYHKYPHKFSEMLNNARKKVIEDFSICCFAGNNIDILMWSHYANFHEGICIKFDIMEDPDFFHFPKYVKYSVRYPQYNHVRDTEKNPKQFGLLYTTKAECWKYEDEVRLVHEKSGLHTFKSDAVIEVFFGCKCNEDNISSYSEIIKLFNPNVKLKKAIKSDVDFSVKFINLK